MSYTVAGIGIIGHTGHLLPDWPLATTQGSTTRGWYALPAIDVFLWTIREKIPNVSGEITRMDGGHRSAAMVPSGSPPPARGTLPRVGLVYGACQAGIMSVFVKSSPTNSKDSPVSEARA